MAQKKWISSKQYTGVRWYEDKPGTLGVAGRDKVYNIRYMVCGERYEANVGRQSDGMDENGAYEKRKEFIKNIKEGLGEPTPKAAAKKEAEKLAKAKAQEEAETKRKVPFRQFFDDEFIPDMATTCKPDTIEKAESHMKIWIGPVVGDLPFDEIKLQHANTIKKNLTKVGRSARTIEYVFVTFSAVWRLAKDYGVASSVCPTKRKSFRLPKVSNARKRFLTADETQRLFSAIEERSPKVLLIAQISYDCGLRFGEIASLRWSNIDFEDGAIEVLNGKGEKDRDVPMTKAVHKMLSDMPQGVGRELVFPDRKGNVMRSVSQTYPRAVKLLKLNQDVVDPKKKVTFHTLRHTYASRLVKSGVDLYRVQKLMGHSSIRQTERYSHLANSDLKEAVRKMEEANGKG